MLVLRILGGHAADGDDAVQEAWIRAVAGIATFRGESGFGTWLNGIGVRAAWEALRRRRPAESAAPYEEPAIDPPDSAGRLDLEDALRRLPDDYRAVVVLHDVEGYGHAEIAASLEIAVGTSRSHLSRARQLLRTMLNSEERMSK
jgi:RNA polymerase sigma-70 factor (ECF subfamily)